MKNDPDSSKLDPTDAAAVIENVKDRYATFVTVGTSCCGPSANSCCGTTETVAERLGYTTIDLDLLPDGANLGLGCGAPVQFLDLEAGETVVDLGSGAGIDALIAATKVGEDGLVIGVDMTPEMIAAARTNAKTAGAENVDFREGQLDALPIEDATVDAITSNCVINLVPDKSAVFREIARVLRPGGRLVVSDIILDGELPETVRDNLMAYVGCVAGAEQRENYFKMLSEAGLGKIEILKDEDFLEMTEKATPTEVVSIIEGAGIDRQSVVGLVRSVTYRATKA